MPQAAECDVGPNSLIFLVGLEEKRFQVDKEKTLNTLQSFPKSFIAKLIDPSTNFKTQNDQGEYVIRYDCKCFSAVKQLLEEGSIDPEIEDCSVEEIVHDLDYFNFLGDTDGNNLSGSRKKILKVGFDFLFKKIEDLDPYVTTRLEWCDPDYDLTMKEKVLKSNIRNIASGTGISEWVNNQIEMAVDTMDYIVILMRIESYFNERHDPKYDFLFEKIEDLRKYSLVNLEWCDPDYDLTMKEKVLKSNIRGIASGTEISEWVNNQIEMAVDTMDYQVILTTIESYFIENSKVKRL